MNYPKCLGRHINLMPANCRSAEWFKSLPPATQKQFYEILSKFPCASVAAEYLKDNHTPSADRWRSEKPSNLGQSKFPKVDAVLYSNCLKIAFSDGVYRHKLYNSPANWRYVGVIYTPDGRIVKCSRDSDVMARKLNLERKRMTDSGIEVTEPQIYRMFIKVAENIQERVA